VSPPVGCQKPHPPSPFIIITQPESWYSFYRPTEGRRLSWPRHCSKGAQPVPKAVYRSDVYDKHATAHGGFEPRSSHTAVRHVTARPLPFKISRYSLQVWFDKLLTVRTYRSLTCYTVPKSCKNYFNKSVNTEHITFASLFMNKLHHPQSINKNT